MIYHNLIDKTKGNISQSLGINPFFVDSYRYFTPKIIPMKKLFYIFKYFKEYDLKSKGINNKSTKQNELLRELIYKILH